MLTVLKLLTAALNVIVGHCDVDRRWVGRGDAAFGEVANVGVKSKILNL